jgi:EAL domain-containing protein (putative c-di-GMP-specific phosphodiesterase class I)
VETLIKQADIAMYRVKMEKKNNFCYYSPAMAQHRIERYAMESSLRHALEKNEMELFFQPKVRLSDGSICGAEALIRWNHPEHGLVLPGRFIPLAEETGLITELGTWAIREACANCRAWRQLGMRPVRIAVNLAYPQFADENLFNDIQAILKEMDLGSDSLEFEITETMVMENAQSLMHSLHRIKDFGVHLSIDDFGTGYSSLSYLKRLPVDSVKIDRSFIRDIPDNSDDVAITRAILALVHSLKMEVIAEGVETREQLQFLIQHGCDTVQGFYFSEALPARNFQLLLANQRTYAL